MSKQRRLGKGIDALLQGRDLTQLEQSDVDVERVRIVPIAKVVPNPDQPRKSFPADSLSELARSIEERGIVQPILAEEQADGTFEIVAGERRYRAAQLAGLTAVPILPITLSFEEKLEVALIENVQREDLNAIEEAQAYQDLMDRAGLSQDDVARKVGKSRPAIANSVRLLRLPAATRDRVVAGSLSAGHARALLALDEAAVIDAMAERIEREGLSVRAAERLVQQIVEGIPVDAADPDVRGDASNDGRDEAPVHHTPATAGDASGAIAASRKTVEMARIEQRLIERFGTRVVVNGSEQKGRIEVAYLSMDDLERVTEIMLGSPLE